MSTATNSTATAPAPSKKRTLVIRELERTPQQAEANRVHVLAQQLRQMFPRLSGGKRRVRDPDDDPLAALREDDDAVLAGRLEQVTIEK